jgi:hypothetical protein
MFSYIFKKKNGVWCGVSYFWYTSTNTCTQHTKKKSNPRTPGASNHFTVHQWHCVFSRNRIADVLAGDVGSLARGPDPAPSRSPLRRNRLLCSRRCARARSGAGPTWRRRQPTAEDLNSPPPPPRPPPSSPRMLPRGRRRQGPSASAR